MTFRKLGILFLVVPAIARAEFKNWVYPSPNWQVTAPENVGVDSNKLKDAVAAIKAKVKAEEVVIIRRGYVIHRGSKAGTQHGIWSAAKSFTSTVFGTLIDSGKLGLNDLASNYVPELKAKYGNVTFRNFATMTSGYDASGGSYGPGSQDGSGTPFKVSNPSFAPGTHFAYWDDAMNMFGLALSLAAGKNIASVFQEKVASKIGMTKYKWNPVFDYKGKKYSPGSGNKGGITTSAEEIAKLAYLFLGEGSWNGTPVISKQWVKEASSVQVPPSLPEHPKSQGGGAGVYGYNWWINGIKANGARMWPDGPLGAYSMLGAKGNVAMVIPEWEMVVVRLGTDGSSGFLNEFLKRMKLAIK